MFTLTTHRLRVLPTFKNVCRLFLWVPFLFITVAKAQTPLSIATWGALHSCPELFDLPVPYMVEKTVDEAIAKRVAPILDAQAQGKIFSVFDRRPVIRTEDGRYLDIPNSLALQYLTNLTAESHEAVANKAARNLQNLWSQAWVKKVQDRLGYLVPRANALIAGGKIPRDYPFGFEGALPRPPLIPNENDVPEVLFPGIETLIQNPGLFQYLPNSLQIELTKRQADIKSTGNLDYGEKEKILGYTLNGAKNLEIQIQRTLIALESKQYVDELQNLRTNNSFDKDAVEKAIEIAPTSNPGEIRDWASYMSVNAIETGNRWFTGAPRILGQMLENFQTKYPLGSENALALQKLLDVAETKNDKIFEEVTGKRVLNSTAALAEAILEIQALQTKGPYYLMKDLFSADGLTLQLRIIRARVSYRPDLGTSVMTYIPDDKAPKNLPPMPLFVVAHGEGTNRSTAASFRYLLTKYIRSGFNLVPFDLARAALGPDVKGVEKNSAFINKVLRTLKAELSTSGDGNPEHDLPVFFGGRSMGSQKASAHALMYEGDQNPVDAYSLMSLSMPNTMDEQLASIYRQVNAKLFSGIIKEGLRNAAELSMEMLQAYASMKSNPELVLAFKTFGNNLLVLQGDADLDGGPTVIEDLRRYLNKYSAMAHYFTFHMPEHQRADYDIVTSGGKILRWMGRYDREGQQVPEELTEDMFEATHFLDANSEDNQYTKLATQTRTAMAVRWGFADYLATGLPMEGGWPTARERLAMARFKNLRERGYGHSFLSYYLKEIGVSESEVDRVPNPNPYGRNLVERMAWVKEFWRLEKIRALKIYRENGLAEL